jgi:TonB family protein
MGTKKILVVDFDQEFQKFLSQFLRNEGFSVITASDGFAGMDKCKAERPDLVITEAMLPKLHGFELCSRVTHSALHKIPVIIVTGVYRDTVYKTEAIKTFGASAYFEKPLDTDDLLTTVRKILNLAIPPGKKEDVFDEAILESVVDRVKASARAVPESATAAVPAPAKEIRPPQEPKSIVDAGKDEIDVMLRSTLAEFGLDSPKKKSPAPPAPPRPRPEPVALVIPPPPPPAHDAAPRPAESKAGIVEIIAPFGEFSEKKKKTFSPKIFGAVAGVVILSSAMVFVLKPRKVQKIEEMMAPPVVEEVSSDAEAARKAADAEEARKKQTAQAKPKPAVRKAVEAPAPAVEDAGPLMPEANPQMDTTTQETAAAGTGSPAGNPEGEVRGQASSGPENPAESQAAKTKAGDIVPLESVDVQPQVVRKVEPVYPPTAMNLKAETSVTVNALISETGDVLQTTVVGPAKGYLGFDKAAESAVRKWKFRPARKDGVSVRVWKPLTIGFILKKQGSTP